MACAKKLSGLQQKLDALRVQNGQFLLKYQGSGRNLIYYKGISFFLNLFQLQTFYAFSMHHSKPHHQFSTLSDFICYFPCIYWLVWAKWPWNWKSLKMNSEKVESWHGSIISPTWHVLKSWEVYGKNWMHFVYKMDNFFRSIRGRNLIYYKGISFFKLISTLDFLCV
jgi:hypothetical protein